MITQTSLQASMVFALSADQPTRPVQASSRDYGFDFDEEEIGQEWLAPLPIHVSSQAIPELDMDESNQVFPCFLS